MSDDDHDDGIDQHDDRDNVDPDDGEYGVAGDGIGAGNGDDDGFDDDERQQHQLMMGAHQDDDDDEIRDDEAGAGGDEDDAEGRRRANEAQKKRDRELADAQRNLSDPQATGQGRKRAVHERVTTNVLTKYERGRILGARATQIADNAPVLVPLEGERDPYMIACKELQARVIPFIVRRYLPDDSFEDWALAELEVDLDRLHDDRYLSLSRIVPQN